MSALATPLIFVAVVQALYKANITGRTGLKLVSLLLMKYGTDLSQKFQFPLWRLLFIAGAVPALLTFVIRIFVPESEKWKAATTSGPSTGRCSTCRRR